MPQDKSLQMNQTIETAILQLQQSPTPEQLAHTLTVVRRCMQAGGQWIVAVEPVPGGGQVQPQVVTTADGASWWYAFTSFEEQMKSPDTVKRPSSQTLTSCLPQRSPHRKSRALL